MLTTEADYTQGVNIYAQAVDKGDADLTTWGFPVAERPRRGQELSDRPSLPERISDLDMPSLLDLLVWYTAWYDYASNLVPNARTTKNAAESARDFAWAKIRREKIAEKTVSDKDDATRTDMRYIRLNADLETADYKYTMLKAISEGLYRDIETISRAITGLEHRNNIDGHRYTGERKANSEGVGPSRTDVLSRFRRKPGQ
jgi:hypothetical protein